jgi:hypothetical protein
MKLSLKLPLRFTSISTRNSQTPPPPSRIPSSQRLTCVTFRLMTLDNESRTVCTEINILNLKWFLFPAIMPRMRVEAGRENSSTVERDQEFCLSKKKKHQKSIISNVDENSLPDASALRHKSRNFSPRSLRGVYGRRETVRKMFAAHSIRNLVSVCSSRVCDGRWEGSGEPRWAQSALLLQISAMSLVRLLHRIEHNMNEWFIFTLFHLSVRLFAPGRLEIRLWGGGKTCFPSISPEKRRESERYSVCCYVCWLEGRNLFSRRKWEASTHISITIWYREVKLFSFWWIFLS